MLGNLSVGDIEKRLSIQFPEPFRTEFVNKHQPEAENISTGKWHCFDLPFVLVCGDDELAKWVVDNLSPISDNMKGSIKIATASRRKV